MHNGLHRNSLVSVVSKKSKYVRGPVRVEKANLCWRFRLRPRKLMPPRIQHRVYEGNFLNVQWEYSLVGTPFFHTFSFGSQTKDDRWWPGHTFLQEEDIQVYQPRWPGGPVALPSQIVAMLKHHLLQRGRGSKP